MPVYEVRLAGVTLCRSTVPFLGYSSGILKDMQKNGLTLYKDGKREKATTDVGSTGSGMTKEVKNNISKKG